MIAIMIVIVLTALMISFVIATVLCRKPQDPMEKKWFNRTEHGNLKINEMISKGWDYTHDPDARYAYYKKSGDGWSVTIRADQVWIWQEDEGELVFEFPWCDDESSRKFAELAVLGMTDHKTPKTTGFIFGCQVISSNECPKDIICMSSDTQLLSKKIENEQ